MSLRDRPVTALEVGAVGVRAVCPGGRVPLAVVATLEDGERLVSRGPGGGRVVWSDFQVAIRGGSMERDGYVSVSADPRATAERGAVDVAVESIHHANTTARMRVPVRYDCDFVADFAGMDGPPGTDGSDGGDGSDGRDGGEGRDATDGRDGGDGRPGMAGGNGADAMDVVAEVGIVRVPHHRGPLLAVRLRSGAWSELHYVDPSGGRLTIDARGGDGGRGGEAGGAGGRHGPRRRLRHRPSRSRRREGAARAGHHGAHRDGVRGGLIPSAPRSDLRRDMVREGKPGR
ncbi:MAG TPA: hypothetical protein RMH99_09380, partial [Sandaracinaceae bacterium LLY-WYZ-13_1]|nr:hypothetical protein [Sandaracinaceae bacterium LLY-WYZ-13_1]